MLVGNLTDFRMLGIARLEFTSYKLAKCHLSSKTGYTLT